MKQEGYCERCGDFVSLNIEDRERESTLEGRTYRYPGKVALCERCGEEIWLPELNDANLAALYRVYRAENGIPSLEKIRAIPDRYKIGQRPLSRLLGWDETTFARYCDGDIPSPSHADQLQKIAEDPAFYAELLEANKARITEAAYRQSREAVAKL